MRVGVQWTLATPGDWQWFDVTPRRNRWTGMPRKPAPKGGEAIDHTPGWVFALNCQGIEMRGFDHYAIEGITDPEFGDGVKFTLWQSDLEDFAPGTRWVTVWELFEPAPDPRYGGMVNTRQRRTIYAEPNCDHPESNRLPWDAFIAPADEVTAHGIWVTDPLFQAHREAASLHGWREWVS